MPDDREYKIRQAILTVLADVYPGGMTREDLAKRRPLSDQTAGVAEIVTEARLLQSANLITDLRPGRYPWWKITFDGLCQIRKEVAPKEIVWGEEAL